MWGTAINIVLFAFAPFVLTLDADGVAKHPAINASECANSPIIKAKTNDMNTCFKNIVQIHLNSTHHDNCTISGLIEKIKVHQEAWRVTCGISLPIINSTTLSDFIQFSLSNNTFKEFYGDVNCVQGLEKELTTCVKDIVGYTIISKKRKHSLWFQKQDLGYSKNNCDKNTMVKDCVLRVLSTCKPITRKYVSSLFDRAHSNCSNYEHTGTGGTGSGAATALSSHQITIIIISSICAFFV